MTLKERLRLLSDVKKLNDQIEREWLNEGKTEPISDELLQRADTLLHQFYAHETHMAAQAKLERKPKQENSHKIKAQEIKAVIDDIKALQDAKED